MFYKIKPSYILRGWKGQAWTLVKRPENSIRRLTQERFQTLLLCDGVTDLGKESEFADEIAECEREGLIEACGTAGPLAPEQYYQYYDNRYVNMIFWSVTGKCNFRCRHCYMDAPEGVLGELSTEDAFHLIDQMAACGVLRVDLTGGEPFVRRDFWQLVDHILSYKMVIGKIYTNGWLLTEEVLEQFEVRKIRPAFSLSFDGVGWHDWMRGVPGAEEAALRALALCRKRGFATDVEMCIHRGNQELLPQTIDALKRVGVERLKASNVAPTDLWNCNSEGNALSRKEYLEAMLRYIPRYYEAGRPMDLMLGNVISLYRNQPYKIIAELHDGTEDCLNCYLCGSARWACYITPEGRLLPCMPMTSCPEQNSFPRVQDIGLKEGLSDSFYMRFVNGRVKDLLASNAECASCPYRLKCGGGCRATALMTGDHSLMGCDRIMCMLWKEGYVERIRKAADEAIAKYESN